MILDEIGGLPAELQAGGGRASAVKRFDRGPSRERIHIEDFAQVFGLYPAALTWNGTPRSPRGMVV